LDYLTQATDAYEDLGDREFFARRVLAVGELYQSLRQWDKALQNYGRALDAFDALGIGGRSAMMLQRMGMIHVGQLRQPDKALEYFTRAHSISEALGVERDIASALHCLAHAYESLGRHDKALEHYTKALASFEDLGDRKGIAASLNSLGTYYSRRNELDKAQARFSKAIQTYEAVSAQVDDPSQPGAFFSEAHSGALYARYAALLLRRRRPGEALAMAERGRAQALARQLAQNRVDLSRFLSNEDAARLQARTLELTAAGRLLYELLNRPEPKDSEEKRVLKQHQETAKLRCNYAESRLSLLRSFLLTRYPAYGQVQGQQRPSAAQLAGLARRNPDTLFLEWAVVDDQSTLLFALSHRDGLKCFTLPVGRQELEKMVGRFWTAAATARGNEPREARAVYRAVLGPLEKAGLLAPRRYARLVLVGDGPLHELPWAALLDSRGKRLIERYSLSTTVSLGVLTWPPSQRPPTATLMCAVDPVGKGGERFEMARRSGFAPLRYAREETRKVAQLFPGAVGFAGPLAREGEVKAQMDRYALLHFATHGILDAQNGLRSWLLLAPEPAESKEDGRLEGQEIVELPLSARLAVLSACETGRGQPSGGDGLLSLAWAFRAAGCPSIVASQWKVDDRATGKLMVDFYRALKAGQRKDEALRQAMLAVKKEPGYSAPFYWAAFQVIGDTAPVLLPRLDRR
jgi:CHAT domain-containing protein